jgi:ankyrin repeat protein
MKYNGIELTLQEAKNLLQQQQFAVGDKETVVLEKLIEQDSSTITTGRDLVTKLRTALLFAAIREEDPDAVLLQLSGGADINGRDAKNLTPIIAACQVRDAAVLGVLLSKDYGPDLSSRDSIGWTALHEAAYRNRQDLVEALLHARAPLGALADDGRTALAVAASECAREKLALFLYGQVRKSGRELTSLEIKLMASFVYHDSAVTTAARSLLSDSFLQAAGNAIQISSPDQLADQLRGHIGDLYERTATGATSRLAATSLPPADVAMVEFAVADLRRLKMLALAELEPNPEEVIRLIGHHSHASCQVRIGTRTISTGGWSPAQALWHQCLMVAEMIRRGSRSGAEIDYLQAELGLMAEALIRAEELLLAENLFIDIGTLDMVAPGLASSYAASAAASGITLLPCGSRTHATYMTVTPTGNDKRFVLAMHNLGRLVNRYHKKSSPHHYLPYVTTIDTQGLPAVINLMIKAYVTFGSLDTEAQLSPVYDHLIKSGTPVSASELEGRFRPMLRQVANNCSLANLRSVRVCYSLSKLPDSCDILQKQIDILEEAYADDLWAATGGQVAVDPPITVLRAQGRLYRAAYLGHEQTCDEILRQVPACADLTDEDKQTILHLAAQTGFPEIGRLMLRFNTRTNARDRRGKLPIEYVAGQSELCGILSTGLDQKTFKLSNIEQFLSLFTPTVSLYRDKAMSDLIDKLEPETFFTPLKQVGKAMKIAVFTKSGSVRVGYVEAGYVG